MAYITTDEGSINVPDTQTQLPPVQPTSENVGNVGPAPLRSVNKIDAINSAASSLQNRVLRSERTISEIQNPQRTTSVKIVYNILLALCGNLHFTVCSKSIQHLPG